MFCFSTVLLSVDTHTYSHTFAHNSFAGCKRWWIQRQKTTNNLEQDVRCLNKLMSELTKVLMLFVILIHFKFSTSLHTYWIIFNHILTKNLFQWFHNHLLSCFKTHLPFKVDLFCEFLHNMILFFSNSKRLYSQDDEEEEELETAVRAWPSQSSISSADDGYQNKDSHKCKIHMYMSNLKVHCVIFWESIDRIAMWCT